MKKTHIESLAAIVRRIQNDEYIERYGVAFTFNLVINGVLFKIELQANDLHQFDVVRAIVLGAAGVLLTHDCDAAASDEAGRRAWRNALLAAEWLTEEEFAEIAAANYSSNSH